MLDKLAQEYENEIDLVKVDADDPANEDLMRKHNVMSMPTLVLLNGNEVLGVLTGGQTEAKLKTWIDLRLEVVRLEGAYGK